MDTGNVSITQQPIIEQFQRTAMGIAVTIMDGMTVTVVGIPTVMEMPITTMVGRTS